jgi:hypothetical protein
MRNITFLPNHTQQGQQPLQQERSTKKEHLANLTHVRVTEQPQRNAQAEKSLATEQSPA